MTPRGEQTADTLLGIVGLFVVLSDGDVIVGGIDAFGRRVSERIKPRGSSGRRTRVVDLTAGEEDDFIEMLKDVPILKLGHLCTLHRLPSHNCNAFVIVFLAKYYHMTCNFEIYNKTSS